MNFFQELKEFTKNITAWIYTMLGFSFFFFLFGPKEVALFGNKLFLPLPTDYSFSVLFFNKIEQDLLPSGVKLIVTNPLDAFLSQVMISILLAFIITLPFFLYRILKYFLPALFEKERRVLILTLLPSVSLFFLGCLFAYFFLIPLTFKTLYPFATIIGAIPFFSIQEFTSLIFGLTIASGVMFLLPVFMVFLCFLGAIKADFWKNNWRYAVLVFLIFSAIITPDGTGITMTMLFFPLAGLYFAGYLLAQKVEFRKIV